MQADSKKIGELSQSLGIQLYFSFLRGGAFFLGVWSLFLLFVVLGCASPSGDSDDEHGVGFLAVLSLASFGDSSLEASPHPTQRKIDFWGSKEYMVDVTPWMSLLSAFGAGMYFVYVMWFVYRKIPRDAEALDAASITPADFAFLLDKLPAFDQESLKPEDFEAELKKHFAKVLLEERAAHLGDEGGPYTANKEVDKSVVDAENEPDNLFPEISFARDYGGRLAEHASQAKLKTEIVEATLDADGKKLKKLHTQARKLLAQKKKRRADEEKFASTIERPIYRAYVVCNKAQDKELLLDAYRMSQLSLGYLFQSKRLRFRGLKRIRLAPAPEPSNILWENQDCPAIERACRRGFTKLLVFILLLISTAGILWSQQTQKNETEKAEGKNCAEIIYTRDSNPPNTVVLDGVTAKAYLEANIVNAPGAPALENHFTDCECAKIGMSSMTGDVKTACQDFYDKQVLMFAVTTASSVLVVAINFILKSLLVALAKFERPLTLSGLECAIALKVQELHLESTLIDPQWVGV
ncbi:unnamed protein product, partial [Amoebophrya sp. A25]|eukprot:GSA25T00027733001.1